MTTNRVLIPAMMVMALVLASGASAQANPPELREENDKFVLENEHVTIWFQGKKPMLKIFPAGNESAGYTYKFASVVEYRDVDANDAPSENEAVARLNLEAANAWEVERVETEDFVILNLTLNAPVKLGKNLPTGDEVDLPDREAQVSLVFTLRNQPAALPVEGLNVTVPETHVKYDFIVSKWPFVDAQNNRLALESSVEGAVEIQEVAEVGVADVEANGTAVGALTWLTTANGTLENGTQVEVPVNADIKQVENVTRIVWTYDAANLASLVHDPTIGIASVQGLDEATAGQLEDLRNTVPGAGLLTTGAVVGIAALAAGRRGRSLR